MLYFKEVKDTVLLRELILSDYGFPLFLPEERVIYSSSKSGNASADEEGG